jgi:hypothetical protein
MKQVQHVRWMKPGIWMLMAALCLSACAPKADLGRYTPNGLTKLVDWTTGGAEAPNGLILTPAENDLRATVTMILEEPHASNPNVLTKASAVFLSQDATPPSQIYYARLRGIHPTSLAALVNMIGNDAQVDTVRLQQLLALCDEVNRADAMRAENLTAAPTAKTTIANEKPRAFLGVRARVSDNGDVINNALRTMETRIVSYRTALAHARLDTDETLALDQVSRVIDELDEQVTRLDIAAKRHSDIKQSLLPSIRT